MSYSSEVLADSPWGFWKCDETGGATLADSSGNSRAMTITGTVTYSDPGPATGVTAIKWPANSSTRAATAASNTNSDATLECWVMLTAYPSANMPLIGDQQSFGSGTEDKQIGIQSDGKVKFYLFNGAQRTLVSPSALSLNVWHHIVGTVGAAGMDLRIDRSVVASNGAVVSSFTGGQLFFIRPASAQVGLAGTGVATIADVAYYTTQLSTSRTNAHYDQYVTPPGSGVLDGHLPALTGALVGDVTVGGFIGGVVPPLTASLAGTLVLPGYSAVVLADNPVAYWRLDEPSGPAVTDSSGNGHDGAFVGSLYTRGQTSLIADGVGDPATLLGGDYVSVPLDTWQDVTALTVEAWLRRDSGFHGPIVTRMNYSAGFGRDYVWQILLNADGSFTGEVFRNNGATHVTMTTAAGLATLSVSHHVVLTYDPTIDTAKLFVDGVEEVSGFLTAPLTNNGAAGIAIGSDWANHGTNFSGIVDDVAFYGTALSAAKVLSHYHAGIGAPDLNGTLDGHLPPLTSDLTGALVPFTAGTLDGHLPALHGTLDGIEFTGAVLDGHLTATETHDTRVLALDPVAYYRMDEASGSTMVDSSGNGHDGTYSGVTLGAGPIVGGSTRAATFGAASVATVPDDTWMDTAEWSVEFWVTYAASGTKALVGRGVIPSGDTWLVQVSGTTVEADYCQSPDTLGGSGSGTLTPGVVHQVVATIDASLTVRLYVDGVLIDTDSSFVGSARDLAGDIIVGANGIYDAAAMTMADLALYDYALDASQVADLYSTGAGTGGLHGSLVADVFTEGVLAGRLPALRGSLTGFPTIDGTLDGHLPGLTSDLTVEGSVDGTLDGLLPPLTGDLTGSLPLQSDISNGQWGRFRDGIAVGFYDPPVVAPPGTPADLIKYAAMAYPTATIDTTGGGARAVIHSPDLVEKVSPWYRILVSGVDITYWRGVHTPRPTYSYIEPLLYGPGSLTLPQVVLPFEVPGEGALAFLGKGAPVRLQQVDPDTGLVVGPDLWRGIISKHNLSGGGFSCELAGELAGRAALRFFPVPLFRHRNDLGWWTSAAVRDLGLSFHPHDGPDTGLVSYNWGGTYYLDYLGEVCARAVARSGAQWTIMPGAGGHYRFREKDLTTVDCTIYLDNSLATASLTSDLAEEPNEVYAAGSTVTGNHIQFAVYPGLTQGPPPPYPFHDGSPFGTGTTDADTDTGDGVTVMLWKLTQTGYLDLDDRNGYDAAAAAAVRALQVDASDGPTFVTGIMDPDTWDALYDVNVTDYSLAWSHIEPAAQWRKTRKYKRTSGGSVRGLNPAYDASIPRVSTDIDVGPGWKNRHVIQRFADGKLSPEGEHHWYGTIALSGRGIILGDHTPGDPLTDPDVAPASVIRAGWNVHLPLFDGGTLFHVSAVAFDATGIPTLTVDTRGRDAREVWEVIRRNKDSRVNIARAWEQSHRSSSMTKDTTTVFDGDMGGLVSAEVRLPGHTWTVIPVPAGQEGTMRTIRLITDPMTEFVVGAFGREPQPAWLDAKVGNPLTKAGSKRWNSESVQTDLDDRILLYVAGDHDNPCGYWPRTKQIKDSTDGGATGTDNPDGDDDTETDDNDEGTPVRHNPLTGKWRDDSGFPFRTYAEPVVYLAIYTRHDTRLQPGRVLWPVNEPGS